jgi:predicted RecB family nuclease
MNMEKVIFELDPLTAELLRRYCEWSGKEPVEVIIEAMKNYCETHCKQTYSSRA